MSTSYVKKLASKHGVSTSTAEKHWKMAKASAQKEGHGEDYGYVNSIFKNMMHENCYVPTLKDLTNGMTFKYFLVAEADEEAMAAAPERQKSFIYKHLEDRFPQFGELSFKSRRELEKEIQSDDLLGDYDQLPQEEKDSIDDHLHDLVIDKMHGEVGRGVNFRDWNKEDEEYRRRKEEHDREQAEMDDAAAAMKSGSPKEPEEKYGDTTLRLDPEKKKRASSGPRHIAAMRQQHIPTDKAAFAPAGSDEIGGPVKSYYKPWGALNPEQRAKRGALAKKHGTIYRVKNANWFRAMPEEKQNIILNVLKQGGSVIDARKAAEGGM
jgi:hypothetical protein